MIGSFGFAARTSQGSEIRHENSSKQFWEVQDTGFVDELFCDVSFTDPDNGWAVGIVGTIIHTSDGGKTWEVRNPVLKTTSSRSTLPTT